jgi:hypothetical protein
MFSKDEVSAFIPIDLPEELSRSEKAKAKKDIAEYVLTSILDYVGEGKSPIVGESFKKLGKSYADNEKGGDRTPNLDLNGDMLDALISKPKGDGIEIGIFKKKEAIKAYNHNIGDTLPRRRFIPAKNQTLKKDILNGIDDIIQEYLDARETNNKKNK